MRGDLLGINAFVDNLDGTVTDEATGLTWMQMDSGLPMEWEDALAYVERFVYTGHDDWRFTNAQGPKDASATAFITRRDQDGDGMVSKAEFGGPAIHFSQADKNHDGLITEAEVPAGPPPAGSQGRPRR